MLLVAWKFLYVQQHKRLSGVDSKRSSDHSLIRWLLLVIVDESEVLCTLGGTHKRDILQNNNPSTGYCHNWTKVGGTYGSCGVGGMIVLKGKLLLVMLKAKIENRKHPGYLS